MAEQTRIRDFKDLDSWRKAFDLALSVYRITLGLPSAENFGLSLQMRRAAVSIASNIAEEFCRGSRQDYIRFLHMARGSAAELETQLMLAERLQSARPTHIEEVAGLLRDVQRLVSGLIRSLARNKERHA